MCGIAGILNLKGRTKHTAAILAMTNRISHRGPDAEGFYSDEIISLGHRRLSIIDLHESANQPMEDATGRYTIIFNGEIYNYREIKSLITGFHYKTESDTEVIVAAYATWGADCVKQMNGMFAFALWDKQDEVLFIARDRLGKKPLYYYHNDDYFVFGSEVRSLLASGLVPRQLEENSLTEYLMYQAPMGTNTMIHGVRQLPAGHYGIMKNGVLTKTPYWNYEVPPSSDNLHRAKQKIKELMLDAVRLRMISDVPLGAFLSGGIDSSLIVACMAEQSEAPINTFTVSFHEKEFDESDYAAQIASMYRTDHHRILLSPHVFLDSMEEILASMDSPSGDGPNTYIVSKHTREAGIKVALSGLGGDELFAGYDKFLKFQRLMRHQWLIFLPARARHMIAHNLLMKAGHKLGKLAELYDLKNWDLSTIYPVLRRAYSKNEVRKILINPSGGDQVESQLAITQKQVSHLGSLSNSTIGEIETYTRDILLRDSDQMSMAHALEVRVPFFDFRLVEYVLSLPDDMKYPHTPKQLLVEAMSPRLPKQLSHRKKMGFSLPWEYWLKNELAAMADQKIKYLADRKEFNGSEVMKKWTHFKSGNSGILWSRIWQLVVLSDWMHRNEL